MIKKIDNCKLSPEERFKALTIIEDDPNVINLIQSMTKELNEFELPQLQDNNVGNFARLYIPGNIHHFHKPSDPSVKETGMYDTLMVTPLFFSKILLMDGFLADHSAKNYELVLESLCSSLPTDRTPSGKF